MLKRQRKSGAKLSSDRLRAIFKHQVQQIQTMLALRKIPTLFVNYRKTIENPEGTAARLKVFHSG